MFDKTDLQSLYLAKKLAQMEESGELQDFVDFARNEMKKQGIKEKDLDEFFNWLEEQAKPNDDGINWFKVGDIICKVTGCKCKVFKGDECVIIENEVIDLEDIVDMLNEDDPKINLNNINIALETIGVQLEFIEAYNFPFENMGFSNFLRFKVVEL